MLAVAYGSAAPQLGVAEFAPTANKEIEAPPTTAGDSSSQGGAGARAKASTTTAPQLAVPETPDSGGAAPTTRIARSRTCIGNPPRQTEDPMSPACMTTIFEGDNGGSTTTGVSATEIRIAVPVPSGAYNWKNGTLAINVLFDHFNRRFEFYGRKLVPVPVQGSGFDATSARALGATVAAEGVFGAVTGYFEAYASDAGQATQGGMLQELARNQIVTITHNSGIGWSDRVTFDPFHPYLWSINPSSEENQDNLASLSCAALKGRLAAHAGDATLKSSTRKFGAIALGTQVVPNVNRLSSGLAACDETLLVAPVNGTSSDQMRTAFSKLKAEGVTTVFCICEGLYGYISVRSLATSANFLPEWVLLPSPLNFEEFLVQGNKDRNSLIRLESGPRLLPIQARPWFAPLLEGYGFETTADMRRDGFYMSQAIYSGLLVLASGIQAAGPSLTAESFAAGLMATQFPNPGAGAAPFWHPTAGFGPGDHSFHDDYAVAWWSDSAAGVEAWGDTNKGSWCYLGAGARFRVGSYPTDAASRLFNPAEPCR